MLFLFPQIKIKKWQGDRLKSGFNLVFQKTDKKKHPWCFRSKFKQIHVKSLLHMAQMTRQFPSFHDLIPCINQNGSFGRNAATISFLCAILPWLSGNSQTIFGLKIREQMPKS